MSVEDRFRQTETLSTQRDEHCGCHSERVSASSVKKDGNDMELNGETDEEMEDEETEFDDGSTQEKNIRDHAQSTLKNTDTTQIVVEFASHLDPHKM